MLHFLLLLSSLTVATRAAVSKTLDVRFCPVSFYGDTSNKLYMKIQAPNLFLSLKRYRGTPKEKDLIRLKAYINMDELLVQKAPVPPDDMLSQLADHIEFNRMQCAFRILIKSQGKTQGALYYANVGSHSVLYADGHFARRDNPATISYLRLDPEISFDDHGHPNRALLDLTGCRDAGDHIRKVNISSDVNHKCSIFKGCNANHSLVLEDFCHAGTVCNGRGRCDTPTQPSTPTPQHPDVKCSVFASLVLDNADGETSIRDRCVYTLLTNDEVQVLGWFDFRRDTYTPLLDNVLLTVDATDVRLLQGGRVQVNGTSVNIGSDLQTFDSVDMYRDKFGLKVQVRMSYGNLYFFFDGVTLDIQGQGSGNDEGPCIKEARGSKYRRMDLSDISCRERLEVIGPNPITDCEARTQQCEALFDLSYQFIFACTSLMCTYGDLDDLLCHIRRAFDLRIGDASVDLDCPRPTPCLDQHCASHEFCALEGGDAKCACRESIIYSYKKTGVYGDKTECGEDTASVELPICLVEYRGFDVHDLHLLDKSCKGHIDQDSAMVIFKFTHTEDCGAMISSNQTHIIYNNTILLKDVENGQITREELVYLSFSCAYEQPDSRAMTISIMDRSVVQEFLMGVFKHTMVLKACTDHECRHELMPRDKQKMGQTIWIKMDVDHLDSRVALLMDHCWGSVLPNGKGELRHKLITDGCADPSDRTVKVIENGDGDEASFSFKLFKFLKYPGKVHLYCTVRLCLKDRDNHCRPKCGKKMDISMMSMVRRRRSEAGMWAATVSPMTWTNQGSDD